MKNLNKSRPVGITVITILIFLCSAIIIIAGLYFLITAQDLSNKDSNSPFSNMLLNFIIWNSTLSIIGGLVLCLVGVFLFQGRRWAKIVLGVIIWINILGGTSIPILVISLGIFIYVFFFRVSKEFFKSA